MTALLAAIAAFNVGLALGRIFERLDYHRRSLPERPKRRTT